MSKGLYNRNYQDLIESEIDLINEAELFLNEKKRNGKVGLATMKDHSDYHKMLPRAFFFNNSLFPNNYLNIDTLKDSNSLKEIQSKFLNLLNSDITERDILNFININSYYNIIASIIHIGYDFGHHEAFLFKEFELTSTFKADYLIIGKNSGGYNFIFIELENPYVQITTKKGELGSTIRKGIRQVEDWNSWIEGNFSSLKLIFDKYKNKGLQLPNEFLTLDKSRIHYVVVAGRRDNFLNKTHEIKRRLIKSSSIKILHYDNLYDSFGTLINLKVY